MSSRDAKEIIHEALIMYIDDVSKIENVNLLPEGEAPSKNEALGITFKDGDKFQILIVRSSDA
jgi:hypothetical protein